MEKSAKRAGTSLLVFVFAFAAPWGLEIYRTTLGFEDADNPGTMMAFLRQHLGVYHLSGLAYVLTGLALLVAILSLWEVIGGESDGLLVRAGAVLGLFAAAFFFGQGVLRVQAPGTLLHMGDLDPSWGEAGYLAVQMAGTQGLGSAGGYALSMWAIATSVAVRGRLPYDRLLLVLAVAPALFLLIGMFGPLVLDAPGLDFLYFFFIGSIPGVMLWSVVLAIALLRWRRGSGHAPTTDHAPHTQ